jgi:lysophospholipase L1-like esterase
VWDPATNLSPAVQDCHRSLQAYPTLVAQATGFQLLNLSCSGASIPQGILGTLPFDSKVTGAAQLGSTAPGYAPPNTSYDSYKPDVVTLTLGMDDIDFSDILSTCYTSACGTASQDQKLTASMSTFETNLKTLLGQIQSRGAADDKIPWVVMTNYYDPFSKTGANNCGDINIGLGFGLSNSDITWLQSKLVILNQDIVSASASYPKIKVVDISGALSGHELCTAVPWAYGPSIWYSDFGDPAPFHPTPAGQQAISALVVAAMKTLPL